MNQPLISVIMSVYAADQDQLSQAINSILNQTYNNFELIIALDDLNKYQTEEFILNTFNDSRITVYTNKENLRLAGSLNELIKHTKGDYIARMDQDDIAKPYRLEKELQLLLECNSDLVAGNIECIDENNQLMYCFNGAINDQRLYEYYELPHPTWLVKKSLYEELNGYRMVNLAEDLDFLIRARIAGKKFNVVEDVVLSYRIVATSISRTSELQQKYLRKYLLDYSSHNEVPALEEVNTYMSNLPISEKDIKDYSKSRYYYKKSVVAYYHKQKLKRYYYIALSLLVSKKAREFRFKK